ncbi:MAG: peptidoglycan-binding domain-containing protein [Rickettsiales bacterium]|nr:peptidoglycan-binding domain-containing protein [Rickettsiales bacterium]
MKISLSNITRKTFLLASVFCLVSCQALNSQPNDNYSANPVRIVEDDKNDNLIKDSEKSRIVIPSVSEKIVINKDTVSQKTIEVSEPKISVTDDEKLVQVETPKVEVVKYTNLVKKEEEQKPEIKIEPIKVTETKTLETPAIPSSDGIDTESASNASVGECYGKVRIAPKFKEVTEQVLVEPERVQNSLIPAKYATKEEEIVVKEETYKFVEIPATYKTITEQVVIEPEKTQIITIPAKYTTIKERVIATPARKVWKKGNGLITKVGQDGDILCLVEEPATYKEIDKQIEIEPERKETRIIPAVTKTITKQVVDAPAKVEKIYVPAVKQKVQRKVLVEAEKTISNKIPPVYKIVRKQVQTSEPRVELKPVICERNINSDLIYRLQAALAGRGYDVGVIDGKFGTKTAEAIYLFQKSLGLESSGITFDAIKALNIQTN